MVHASSVVRPPARPAPLEATAGLMVSGDELVKPLASYRAEELEKMRVNFFGSDLQLVCGLIFGPLFPKRSP